jgi:hypothetical protein
VSALDVSELYFEGQTAERPQTNGNSPARPALDWKPLSEIATRPIVFADKPHVQASAFHLLVGRKNAGKGTYLANLAARVTRGELGVRRRVLWIAAGEDSYAIDVRPRIEAAGGVVEDVIVLHGGRLLLPKHAAEIESKATELGDVGLVVIDPLGGSLGVGKSSNLDSDVRPALECLNDLADRLACVIFGVRHLTNKEIRGGVLAGVLGSSDWVNVPRVVLALVHDDQDEDVRHLTLVTGSRVKGGAGRIYRIEGVEPESGGEEVTRAVLVGDSDRHAEELLERGLASGRTSKSSRARDLILDVLEDEGDQESDAFDARIARETGLSARTVRDLRMQLASEGLVKNRPGKDEVGTVKRWFVCRTSAGRPES